MTRMPRLRAFIAAVAAAAVAAPAGAAASSVTVGGNARHDGVVAGVPEPPLGVLWARDLGGQVSYPVVAGGRAFVVTRGPEGAAYGTTLHALELATGRTLWTRAMGHTYFWAAPAYEDGRVIVANADAVVQAFSAQTGETLWTRQLPGQYAGSSPPTVVAGRVYTGAAGSGGTLYALRAADGAVLWTRPVANGSDSSPAVDDAKVYVSYSCAQVYAFQRDSGDQAWHHAGDCSGGGGNLPILHAGRLFTLEAGLVFDAASGSLLDTILSYNAPAFADGVAYLPQGARLRAEDATGGAERWTRDLPIPVSTQPLVAGATLYAGSDAGAVFAVDRATGEPGWCAATGGRGVVGHNRAYYAPPGGLGGGEGVLLVPAQDVLAAYGKGGAEPVPCTPQTVDTGTGTGRGAGGARAPAREARAAAGRRGPDRPAPAPRRRRAAVSSSRRRASGSSSAGAQRSASPAHRPAPAWCWRATRSPTTVASARARRRPPGPTARPPSRCGRSATPACERSSTACRRRAI